MSDNVPPHAEKTAVQGLTAQLPTMTWNGPAVCGGILTFAVVVYGVLSRSMKPRLFARNICKGKYAVSPAFKGLGSRYEKAFSPVVPDTEMVMLIGTRGFGKSITAASIGKDRKNAILVSVDHKTGEGLTSQDAVLELLHQEMENNSFKDITLPEWFPFHGRSKEKTMKAVLKSAKIGEKLPTIIIDVHSGWGGDSYLFTEALKQLAHDNQRMRVVLAATEGMQFSTTRDDRWDKVFCMEIDAEVVGASIAANPLYSRLTSEEKELLIKMTPLTAQAVTGGPTEMKKKAKANAQRFVTAFDLRCTNTERKDFAKEALVGFTDPEKTSLNEVINTKAGKAKKTVNEWFNDQFVKSNVMANYTGKYEFQFKATRRLAEKLVAAEGDVAKLEKQLKEEGWI